MAAGLGFKTFNTGDVLTAGDTNGYLMQGVWVFANATARTSAVTSPHEGNVSFLKDTNSLEIYDGAAWVAYGSGDITGVTAGTGISGGGTSGTVTITNSMATEITAAGDIIVGTGNGTFDNLPIGSTGQILTADTTVSPYKVKWATSGASAKVVQYVYAELTTTATTTSSSFADLGLSATIVPTSASNSILAIVSLPLSLTTGSHQARVSLFDGSNNNLCNASSPGSRTPAFIALDGDTISAAFGLLPCSFTFRHSPATTSSTTYKIRWQTGGGTLAVNRYAGGDTDSSPYSRGTATITLLEVAS